MHSGISNCATMTTANRGSEQGEGTRAHYHGGAVLRPAGQHVVVVGAPVDVEDRPRVTYHHGVILVHAASLVSVWTQEKSVKIRTATYSSEVRKNQDFRIKTHVNLPHFGVDSEIMDSIP